MNVLVTGGAGYIGSHAALRLREDGHAVTVVDDLSRGNAGAIAALERIEAAEPFHFVRADLGDRDRMTAVLRERGVEVVMHFGAWTYVGESVEQPLRYFRNNTASALALIEAMDAAGVGRLIFSSTCATYGEPPPEEIPIAETCRQTPINPYGRSKLFVEGMLRDYAQAKGRDFAFAALRYFNVAGSDRHGRIGEDHDPETHLIPICLQAALGQRPDVTIFGTDYPTPDGTCVRDYVHVEDLVDAHVAVMEALRGGETRVYNVGIGRGYSVREVIDACHAVTGVPFRVRTGARRPGDPPTLYADPARIRDELRWQASYDDLAAIVETAWRWMKTHPAGYADRARLAR
ncbi:MAG: UDP-glucose 4-epimerase GalE [Phycisphaerales bacterium]|nr:UDP-glucose 4-epimerase GalE [Phycisphaerae bacterium]NNF44659.1 UDP-glucose 4-epimerase GalE [Phycisphaerales bacterium]NNM27509.1 UDP-glucose 4-epimerase GalE [Phycisphaerales bacterium]